MTEHYFEIAVEVNNFGQQHVLYYSSVSDELVGEKLKKHFPDSPRFSNKQIEAGVLGSLVCERFCRTIYSNNDLSHSRNSTTGSFAFTPLTAKPEKLGEPIKLNSDNPRGLSIWLK